MQKNKQKGLTLIEILVAMGILVLLIGILYSVFSISLRGWKKSDNLLQATTAARFALEQMSREISSALIKKGSNAYYCLGFDGPSGYRTDSVADEFYFIAPLKPGNSDGGSDLCEVGYWLDGRGTTDTRDDTLRRFYVTDTRDEAGSNFDFDFSTPSGRTSVGEFVLNVTNLEFEFYDSAGIMSKTWDSRVAGVPPARIVIKIAVGVGEGAPETNPDFVVQDFTTAVCLRQ